MRPPGEFCTRGPDGRVSDQALHDEILDNAEAELWTRRQSAAQALAEGCPPDQVRQLYGEDALES